MIWFVEFFMSHEFLDFALPILTLLGIVTLILIIIHLSTNVLPFIWSALIYPFDVAFTILLCKHIKSKIIKLNELKNLKKGDILIIKIRSVYIRHNAMIEIVEKATKDALSRAGLNSGDVTFLMTELLDDQDNVWIERLSPNDMAKKGWIRSSGLDRAKDLI